MRKLTLTTLFRGRSYRRRPTVLLSLVDDATCAGVRADPPSVLHFWRQAQPRITQSLPADWRDLDNTALVWLFVTALAHGLKPYGPGSSGIDLKSLLSAPALDCSTYGHLAHHLATIVHEDGEPLSAAFIGWHGGAIGNHQILMARAGARGSLLLDPTLAVAARVSFDDLASGVPCDAAAVLELSASAALAGARKVFVDALIEGAFRPSHLLYYFERRELLLSSFGHIASWPTPGAAIWRAENATEFPR